MNPIDLTYVLRELAKRVGVNFKSDDSNPFKHTGVEVFYSTNNNNTIVQPSITIIPSENSCWDYLLFSNTKIEWVLKSDLIPPNHNDSDSILLPILFWGNNTPHIPKFIINKNNITLYYDLIAGTFFMLSRWEESVQSFKDKHGRFPAEHSLAFKQGFLDIPIVDEYALILRSWIQYLNPNWKPLKRKPGILLTHDIDHIVKYSSPLKLFKSFFTNYRFGKKSIINNLKLYKNECSNPDEALYYKNITELAKLSIDNNLNSIFFFQTSKKSLYDSGYDINIPAIQSLIVKLIESGFTIGLHSSYFTMNNINKIQSEKFLLDKLIGFQSIHCRQHFLRVQLPDTLRNQEEVGFLYDHSLGYPQHEGFRCGTCHPYHPYDLEKRKELKITVVPLIVMDNTLRNYRKLSIDNAEQQLLILANRSYQVEGTFTLLWHNTSLHGNWEQWGKMYSNILPKLVMMLNK
ncbi:MAG: polysaccharide deacetylase family protein [Pelolinea sp.]|nr:polysaccharide deacetylase family protein [Pelolinea sp.]